MTEDKDYAGVDGFILISFLGLLAWNFLSWLSSSGFAASIGPTVENFIPVMSSVTRAYSIILTKHMSGSPAS